MFWNQKLTLRKVSTLDVYVQTHLFYESMDSNTDCRIGFGIKRIKRFTILDIYVRTQLSYESMNSNTLDPDLVFGNQKFILKRLLL